MHGYQSEDYNGRAVKNDSSIIGEVGIFLAGVLAASLWTNRKSALSAATSGPAPCPSSSPPAPESWRRAVSDLERRLTEQETANSARLSKVETKLTEQGARLAELPSSQQIVGVIEQVISRTMSSLDDRLSNQAHSIEVLKNTVSQTDSLLERVLESLDSLQSYADPLELKEEPTLSKKAV